MPEQEIPFVVSDFDLDDNIHISIIDVECINNTLKNIIDNNLSQICLSELDDLQNAKIILNQRLNSWPEATQKGAVAEFFIHLYMRQIGFNQECLFLNLEEGTIKKGFDGLYSNAEELWIMESKSGDLASVGVNHASKVREAFNDLKQKVSTGESNNPWLNAYNHAKIVGTKKTLRQNIKKLSDDFTNHIYHSIEELNIVPCATIFLNGIWEQYDHNRIKESIQNMRVLKGKNIHVICVTQKSYDMFKQYLEG